MQPQCVVCKYTHMNRSRDSVQPAMDHEEQAGEPDPAGLVTELAQTLTANVLRFHGTGSGKG